jgi:hypothetical protein
LLHSVLDSRVPKPRPVSRPSNRSSPRRRTVGVRIGGLLILGLVFASSGCASFRLAPAAPTPNPFFVRAQNYDAVWELAVDTTHDYFEIARESKITGEIETRPKVGASLLEPWHRDSVGFHNRLESSLQSIRRRAFIRIKPEPDGCLVSVEVFKEIEHLAGAANNTAGGASFQTTNPLRRDLNLVVGQSAPSGWIILGRDERLEQKMLARLQKSINRVLTPNQ